MSKFIDYDDWRISNSFFCYLNQLWGPYTIDRFANQKNAKTVRYNALFWNPQCEAVDAFTQDWSNEVNWVVPPVFLISKALRHAKACRASGTLIAPCSKTRSSDPDGLRLQFSPFSSGSTEFLAFLGVQDTSQPDRVVEVNSSTAQIGARVEVNVSSCYSCYPDRGKLRVSRLWFTILLSRLGRRRKYRVFAVPPPRSG